MCTEPKRHIGKWAARPFLMASSTERPFPPLTICSKADGCVQLCLFRYDRK